MEKQQLENFDSQNKNSIKIMPEKNKNQLNENKLNEEEFAKEKVLAIDSSAEKFTAGMINEESRLTRQFNASSEITKKYQKMLDLISEKVRTLATQSKKRITQILVGTSMLSATSAIADTQFSKQNIEKVASDINIELGIGARAVPINPDGIIDDKLKEITPEEETKIQVENIKQDIIEQIASNEYLQKLTTEFGGNEKKALREQKKRIQNIKTVKVFIADLKETNNKLAKFGGGNAKIKSNEKVPGFYRHDKLGTMHEIHIASDSQDKSSTIAHELWHASTHGDDEISMNAKKKLSAGYLKISKKDDTKYYSQSTEMLVRKKALEDDMLRLGIKDYGEPFTEDHHDKLLENYENLQEGSKQFLKRIKYENLKEILDSIAKNEIDKNEAMNA